MSRKGTLRLIAVAMGLTLTLSACGGDDKGADTAAGGSSAATSSEATSAAAFSEAPASSAAAESSAPAEAASSEAAPAAGGSISGDGSSTVFPIMEGVAEEMKKQGIDVTVGESGTGGGFKKFCAGETDFSNASRAIKDEEKAVCEKNGVKFEEFKIASDGLAVVSNKDLKVDCLTKDELKTTFIAGSKVKQAKDIKGDLAAEDLKLFTPGADSGTYDFFLEEVLGKKEKFRADGVTTSEDDNVLVTGISGTKGGLGFFGFAYFA